MKKKVRAPRKNRSRPTKVTRAGPAATGLPVPLVDAFPDRSLDSPARSLVPFLAYWAHAADRLHAIRGDFGGERALEGCDLRLDAPSASDAPHHAAYTDLMASAPGTAVSFTARWTEPMSETIQKWRERRPPQAKSILDGWFERIASVTRRKGGFTPEDDALVLETVQQLAALCAMGKPKLHLVYQLFGGWHEREYEAALSRLSERIGNRERVAIWMQTIHTTPSAPFEMLRRNWRDIPPASRVFELRELLWQGKAFHFGESNWLRFV